MPQATLTTRSLPCAFEGPPVAGKLRQQPEDFQVEELLSFEPSGSGEHALIKVRKRGENTLWVTRQLARVAGVPSRDVGYAGLKDRHAVTTQWFTVGLAGKLEPDWGACVSDSLEILEVVRHNRKLRSGAVVENRFSIHIRELKGSREALGERLDCVAAAGVPNYFGEQRFGRDGDNVNQALALFADEIRVRDRKLRGIYLSAARSWLFNAVLAERVTTKCWNRALPGDVMALDGRRAVFLAERLDDTLLRRVEEHDIHPTGPLWGQGEPMTVGAPADLEKRVASEHETLADGLIRAGMKQERRALRLRVRNLKWALGTHGIELSFGLQAGSFATAVLRELTDYRSAPHLD